MTVATLTTANLAAGTATIIVAIGTTLIGEMTVRGEATASRSAIKPTTGRGHAAARVVVRNLPREGNTGDGSMPSAGHVRMSTATRQACTVKKPIEVIVTVEEKGADANGPAVTDPNTATLAANSRLIGVAVADITVMAVTPRPGSTVTTGAITTTAAAAVGRISVDMNEDMNEDMDAVISAATVGSIMGEVTTGTGITGTGITGTGITTHPVGPITADAASGIMADSRIMTVSVATISPRADLADTTADVLGFMEGSRFTLPSIKAAGTRARTSVGWRHTPLVPDRF